MNLIICIISWLILINSIQFTIGAYKKRKNEHCSLQVNSMCYDDELNDKPLKIVHENGMMKSIIDDTNKIKKNHQRKIKSTDVLQSKSLDSPRFKLFSLPNRNSNQKSKDNQLNSRSQLDQSKLIFKYHKLDDSTNNRLSNSIFTNLPRSILDTSTMLPTSQFVFNQLSPTLSSPIILSTLNYPHLNKFKTINRPLFAASSLKSKSASPPLLTANQFLNKFSYPLVSPFANSLTLSLPDHSYLDSNSLDNYLDSSLSGNLLSTSSLISKKPSTTKLLSNYLPKNLPNKDIPKNIAFQNYKTTTPSTPSIAPNYWLPNSYYLTTPSNLIVPALPTNLTNYINLRESGKLGAFLKSSSNHRSNEDENVTSFNTTQDRIWTDDDQTQQNDPIFPTKTTANLFNLDNFKNSSSSSNRFQFENSNEDDSINKINSFDQLDAKNLLTTTDLSNGNYLFSTEESSKELENLFKDPSFKLSNFKLQQQQDNSNEDFINANNYLDKDSLNKFSSLFSSASPNNKHDHDVNSKESFLNEKFESAQPLNQHDWPIDDLLVNANKKKHRQSDKSTINYLTDDEQKDNLLINHNNYPVFYPSVVKNGNKQHPTYTIIQTNDKKDKLKRYVKIISKAALDEAKKFKKNELETFLKRKRLIIDRYKPNDMYQKAIAAKYVWKKVSLVK